MAEKLNKTTPGIHPSVIIKQFDNVENKILSRLCNEFFITTGGCISLLKSRYKYFLMKPTQTYSEMFNIEREIVCLFSEYENFEPRTLDAFHEAQNNLADLRVESVCRILISNDEHIETKIESLIKADPEQPIVIPFTYRELKSGFDNYFLRNRFRKHFYSRDLFSFLSPLKKDLYFFGRNSLIQEIVNRHRSGEHTGLFGLRKSGKTSIVYAIERYLTAQSERYLSFDCESPSFHQLRWNELLKRIVIKYQLAFAPTIELDNSSERYNEKSAADSFQTDILRIFNLNKQPTLLIFDEIERISPQTSSSKHWQVGKDFIYFWQTLRGFYQRHRDVYTYLLVGTNPTCVEKPYICEEDNPLFTSIPYQYVPNFELDDVRNMVRRLGRYMGLKFDEMIYYKLTEDYGGHPFLIRQICSRLHKLFNGKRPIKIDRAMYNTAKENTVHDLEGYFQMMLQVLRDWYPDEYKMIEYLALGDIKSFNEFASSSHHYTKHLVGYGILQSSTNGFTFNIESIKDFLKSSFKFKRLNLLDEEKLAEISHRRNRIESSLRVIIKNALLISCKKGKALGRVLSSLSKSRALPLQGSSIETILHKNKSPLYFSDLSRIISNNWDKVHKIFNMNKGKLLIMLDEINNLGRPDAHSKEIKDSDFIQIRLHFEKLEEIIDKWKW